MGSIDAAAAAELFRSEPHRYLAVVSGEVAYWKVGSGPDVLFVHGWPVSGATFRTLLPYLVDHVTCHIIDFPGAGSSRFSADSSLSIAEHISTLSKVVDQLGLSDFAVVGHDSGGLIARHAFAGDPRVRAFGLIDTEQPRGLSWRFKSFLIARKTPGLAKVFGWIFGQRRLRRNPLILGGAFADLALLDGEFDEFFLRPIATMPTRADAAVKLLRTFDTQYIKSLGPVHQRINVPVQLVWGEHDPFFPVAWAREMVGTFPNAKLAVINNTRLFCHEERPEEVARALLPALLHGQLTG